MILTGKEILKQVELGEIHIRPLITKHVGPNSIDVTLHSKLLVYKLGDSGILDMRANNPTEEVIIEEDGLVLQPNCLYLGCTNETATSKKFIPMFEGRSSIGRLGINTHITAGFGDVGWGYIEDADGLLQCHFPTWTLEIAVVHPIRIYPGVRIGQVYFMIAHGELSFYKGKYSLQREPQASRLYIDFKEKIKE